MERNVSAESMAPATAEWRASEESVSNATEEKMRNQLHGGWLPVRRRGP